MANGAVPRDQVEDDDTPVDLTQEDLDEFEQDSRTPVQSTEFLRGYELGRRDERLDVFNKWGHILAGERRMGKTVVLQALRDQLVREGNSAEVVEHIVGRLATAVGVYRE